jgi:hypothetical protein
MAISVIPAPSAGGGIKAVQRGLAASAGTVTITAVDMAKSFVTVYGTASSGTVGGTAAVSAQNGSTSASSGNINGKGAFLGGGSNFSPSFTNSPYGGGAQLMQIAASGLNANGQNISFNAQSLSGGSNNLVAAVVQGYLSGSTSLVVSGACRWEVVEFA